MRSVLLSLLPAALFVLSGCMGDIIETTDDAVDDSGGSSTTLLDPDLGWSASSCEATFGADNTFPTLTNRYGVTVTYSSSDTDVATIASDGTVTLVAAGSTTITAVSSADATYEASSAAYTLTVTRAEGAIAWSAETATATLGEDNDFPELSNENNLTVTYSSSDESVATISSSGAVKVIAVGSTTVTATSEETDRYAACSVSYTLTVTRSSVSISWSASECTVTIGAKNNTFPTLSNPGNQTVTYSSSNTDIATISSDGTVTLVAEGSTSIIATSAETEVYAAASVHYTLTVQAEGSNLVSPELSWSASTCSATMGTTPETPTLTNPYNLSVSYASSDTGVATVSSAGVVTLVGAGSATITASSEATDTYRAGSASYTLTVSLADAGLAWSASTSSATMADDNTFPTLTNENGLTVTYSSSNTDVATVDAKGNVTLVGAGTTAIIAASEATSVYAAGSVSYTLRVVKHDVTLTWSSGTCNASLEADDNSYPTLTVDPSDTGLAVGYSSSNTAVATISSSGAVTLVAVGTTTISATVAGDDTYKAASASYTLTVSSGSDDGAGTYTYSSTGDTSSGDDISGTTFTRMITVTYSSSGTATVTGDYYGYASVSGNHVTVNNTGEEAIVYKLTGTATDGSFKLYSSKKQAILLSGVSLTNPAGAAINNQSGKRTFVMIEGTNTLADGSSAAYSTDSDEDMKAVFFSEGQLVFSGSGSLTVTANNKQEKSGIVSDDYVRIMDSPTIKVTAGSSAGHGVRGKEYVQISNGTLTISTSAAKKKGIGSDDYVLVEGGTTNITVSGGVAYDSDDAEYKGTAGIKADNYFAMTGGTVTIKNTGSGGKGVRAGDYSYVSDNGTALTASYISGGTLTITTTGSESNDVSCKGIKIGYKQTSGRTSVCAGDMKVTGGTVSVTCSKSEAIEVKGALTISGGSVYAYSTGDDAINSAGELNITGGYVYGYSTANDAIDTNCDFKISGGYVFAATTKGSPEVALDANTESGYKLYIYSGATVVAYGGLESGYSASQTVYSLSATAGSWNALHNGSSYIAAFKAPSGLSSFAVSAPSLSKGYKAVSVSGTTYCNGNWASSGISGGTEVSLSSYSGGSQGGGNQGGGNPGGGGHGR